MNRYPSSAFLSSSLTLPAIKGVAYIIVTEVGKILYSSPQCEKKYSLREGDQTQWVSKESETHGQVAFADQQTQQEGLLTVSAVFDLVWHGEQAKMLLLEGKNPGAEERNDGETLHQADALTGLSPWMAFHCNFDEHLEISLVNEQALALTGYSAAELVKGEKAYRSLMSEVDRKTAFTIIQKAIQQHLPYQLLYRIQQNNGELIWVEEHGQAKENKKGEIQYIEGWIVDVSDRKKIEAALWESESRYRSLVEASPDSVLLLDQESRILLGNRHFCDLIGVKDPQTILGQNISHFLKLEKAKTKSFNFVTYWQSLPAGSQIISLVDARGELIPMETNLSVIRDGNGNITTSIVIARDVRRRNQAQRALHESAARYRVIVENNPEMVVRFDESGRVSFANTAFLDFVKLSADELYGQVLLERVKNQAFHLVRKLLKSVSVEMEPLENELSLHNSKTGERWYRWRTVAIRDENGQFLEYQAIGEEITDQKAVRQAEKESEQRLQQLMENIKLIAIILDLQGRVTFCNSYFSELTGWRREEVLGQVWIDHFVPSDATEEVQQAVLGAPLNKGEVPVRHENTILTKNSEKRLITWTNTILQDALGNPIGMASIGEDITEKHEMTRIQDAIIKISHAANEAGNLDALFASIHEILKTLMAVDNFYIALYDRKKDWITFPYYIDQFDTAPASKKPDRGLTEYVLRTGKTVLVNPETFNQLEASGEVISFGAASLDWIGVPLKVENEIIGVMVAQTYSTGIRYTEKDEQLLSFVSTQIAMAIDRKRREQALLASQKRNQLLIAASTDAIFILSLEGKVMDCNDVALELYGYAREELLGMNAAALLYPESARDLTEFSRAGLGQRTRIRNILNIRKEGTVFPVEISLRQAALEDAPVLVAYIRDISEQVKVAKGIIESEERFRTLSETTTAGIFIYNGKKFLYVNPMWCQITGYSNDELMHLPPIELIPPESKGKSSDSLDQWSRGLTSQSRLEHELLTKSGDICIIDLNISRVLFDGQPAVIGTAIDVTNRKLREHELEVISEMGSALRVDIRRDEVLSTAMTELMAIMKLDGAFFSLLNKQQKIIEVQKASGIWQPLENDHFQINEGISGHILSTGKSYINNSTPEADPYLLHSELIKGFSTIAGVPLLTKGETLGALVIGSRKRFSDNDLRLLKAIGDMTASALHRADLFEQTVQQREELRQAYDSTLEGWALALELRDKETQGHSVRIAKLTLKLARRLGIPENELENIHRGALLHDIGKLGVPDTILLKNGTLTPEEWEIMQKHPTYAYEMLSQIRGFQGAIDIPYCHHEWWDGSGYPRGLEGEKIPLAARIFSIVDVWDALTSDRPYRNAWKKKEALAHIINQAGTHFDPDIVNAFIQMIVEDK